MFSIDKNDIVKILFAEIGSEDSSGGSDPTIFAGVGGVAVLIIVAAILIALWKRNKKDEKDTNEGTISNVFYIFF